MEGYPFSTTGNAWNSLCVLKKVSSTPAGFAFIESIDHRYTWIFIAKYDLKLKQCQKLYNTLVQVCWGHYCWFKQTFRHFPVISQFVPWTGKVYCRNKIYCSFTDTTVPFDSFHPLSHKLAAYYTMIYRVLILPLSTTSM